MLLLSALLFGILKVQADESSTVQKAIRDGGEIGEESAQAGGFDFSAMNKIWEIISILERDEEPADDAWVDLTRTPGYAALILHEKYYGLDFLKRNLRLVFKPSLKEELKKASQNRSVRHFLGLREREAEIRDFQARLQNPSVKAEAMELLRPWFPAGTLDGQGPVPASFIVFDNDARGGYGRLIFDIIYALEEGEEFIPLFAHEAFHYLRGKSLAYDEGDVLLLHQNILWSMDMIQSEGIADQIDKVTTLFEDGSRFASSYARRYRENLAETPRILGALDDLFCRLTDDNPDYGKTGQDVRKAVPMSGHPTGYFMTRAILEGLGKEELVRTFNNPFAFFYLYNTAAIKDPRLPRLSNGAILGLHELEKIYVLRPETRLAAAAMVSDVDLSAVEGFRRIVAVLERDEDPSSVLWDGFFHNPGYRVLFIHEPYYSRERIVDLITLVFKPSRDAELKRELEGGGSYGLNHFVRHKKEMASVLKAVIRLREGQLFRKTVNQVRTFLSRKIKEDIFPPSLNFVYFDNDLRFGYPVMLADPMTLVDSADSFPYFLKAYLIWAYTDRVRPFEEESLTQRQYAFIDGLDEIQRYGLCDLLAFEDGSLTKMEIYPRYKKAQSEVSQLIREMDGILARAADTSDVWKEFSIVVGKFFTRPGCPAGYMMSKAIEEIFGRPALIECTGNPLAFIYLYQKAALKQKNLPVFSAEAMRYTSSLESECFKGNR